MKIYEESLINIIREAKDLLSLMETVQSFKNLGAADQDFWQEYADEIDEAYLDLTAAIKEFRQTTYKLNNWTWAVEGFNEHRKIEQRKNEETHE